MSDAGSHHSSIRAGYRRSRMEPVDPASISAPPAKSQTPNVETRPPSTNPKIEDEEKESIFKKIIRFFFVFFNIIFMTIGFFMITTGVVLWIVFRESGLSIADVAGGCSLALIINGAIIVMITMWGCEIAFFPNKTKTSLYMFSLLLIFGLGLFSYFRSQRMVASLQSNLTEYWGTFSTITRSNIQDFGFCCGLNGPIDFPALPCPAGARTGCYDAVTNMESSISTSANAFLGSSTFLHIFLAVSAFILGRPKNKEGEDDIEAAKSENLNKAEVMSQHSQI